MNLHRSIIFWSGLLAIGFIFWAAWHSLSHSASGRYGRWYFMEGIGMAVVGYDTTSTTGWILSTDAVPATTNMEPIGNIEQITMTNTELGSPYRWEAPKIIVQGGVDLALPHWLLFLAVFVPWLGLLYWRARRRKKKSHLN